MAFDWLKVNHLNQAEQQAGSGFLNIFSRHNSLRSDNLQPWPEVKMARKEVLPQEFFLFHSMLMSRSGLVAVNYRVLTEQVTSIAHCVTKSLWDDGH